MATTVQVPQASLENVRAIVEVLADGAETARDIEFAAAGSLSTRHAQYAIAAAQVLGLIEERAGTTNLGLSELGRELHETVVGSISERRVFSDAIQTSDVITELAPGLLSEHPPSRDQIAANLTHKAGLGYSTAESRASVIARWRDYVLEIPKKVQDQARLAWRRVSISDYRSILRVELDLPPFALVVGQNGSGKSNFVDAFVFVAELASSAIDAIDGRGGISGVRRWRDKRSALVSLELRAATTKSELSTTYVEYGCKIRSAFEHRDWLFQEERVRIVQDGKATASLDRKEEVSMRAGKRKFIERTASVLATVDQRPDLKSVLIFKSVRRHRLNPEQMRIPQLASQGTKLDETGRNVASSLREMADTPKMDNVLRVMKKIVPGLDKIAVESAGRHLIVAFEQRQSGDTSAKFTASEMSDGALRALGIVVAAQQIEINELLIVEEPEASIHLGAAALLIDVLKEASVTGNVLITTHSADLIDVAKDEEILVAEYSNSATRIGPIAPSQRKLVKDGLLSFSELVRSEPLRIENP